jgi:hypothetical protein
VRTQFLRTRQELTSIIEVRESSAFVLISPNHHFFARGTCDKRGMRETFVSRLAIYGGVTNVANLIHCLLKAAKTVKFSFQLRKNCVISRFFLNATLLFPAPYSKDYESLVSAVGVIFSIINLTKVLSLWERSENVSEKMEANPIMPKCD